MSIQSRLLWWLVACSSFLLLFYPIQSGFADRVLSQDFTRISLGLTGGYLLITGWVGLALHSRMEFPLRWARYYVHEAVQIGLIGTVIGMAFLFGLHEGATEFDAQTILAGVGTAIFTTLTGAVWAAFMHLQLIVLGHEA